MRKKIIVDINGADAEPGVIARGAISSLAGQDEFDLVLVGDEALITGLTSSERVEIIHAEGTVTNYDDPKQLVRGRDDTSMVKALTALKTREDCVGLVSAGSTGSLMIGSIFRLGLFKGLMQPALSCALYNIKGGYVCLADCGANINCRPKDLVDYARMGSAYMEAMKGVEHAKVGLLNVGKEKGKGTELVKDAYEILKADEDIDFYGNIEGNDVLGGEVDVVVCDGFTGNVLLKNMEATGLIAAKMMGDPENVIKFFDYNSQGGATFLGTKKIVVKAHGAASEATVRACIEQVMKLEKGGFTEKMTSRMQKAKIEIS